MRVSKTVPPSPVGRSSAPAARPHTYFEILGRAVPAWGPDVRGGNRLARPAALGTATKETRRDDRHQDASPHRPRVGVGPLARGLRPAGKSPARLADRWHVRHGCTGHGGAQHVGNAGLQHVRHELTLPCGRAGCSRLGHPTGKEAGVVATRCRAPGSRCPAYEGASAPADCARRPARDACGASRPRECGISPRAAAGPVLLTVTGAWPGRRRGSQSRSRWRSDGCCRAVESCPGQAPGRSVAARARPSGGGATRRRRIQRWAGISTQRQASQPTSSVAR